MDNDTVKPLRTKARDNHGYEYAVSLQLSRSPVGTFGGQHAEELTRKFSNKWTLKVHGTPGSWYMSTLLAAGDVSKIALDFGAGWYVENFGDVMREALENL